MPPVKVLTPPVVKVLVPVLMVSEPEPEMMPDRVSAFWMLAVTGPTSLMALATVKAVLVIVPPAAVSVSVAAVAPNAEALPMENVPESRKVTVVAAVVGLILTATVPPAPPVLVGVPPPMVRKFAPEEVMAVPVAAKVKLAPLFVASNPSSAPRAHVSVAVPPPKVLLPLAAAIMFEPTVTVVPTVELQAPPPMNRIALGVSVVVVV